MPLYGSQVTVTDSDCTRCLCNSEAGGDACGTVWAIRHRIALAARPSHVEAASTGADDRVANHIRTASRTRWERESARPASTARSMALLRASGMRMGRSFCVLPRGRGFWAWLCILMPGPGGGAPCSR